MRRLCGGAKLSGITSYDAVWALLVLEVAERVEVGQCAKEQLKGARWQHEIRVIGIDSGVIAGKT